MVSSTNSLPAAMQFSPLLKNTELMPWNATRTHSGFLFNCLNVCKRNKDYAPMNELTMRTALSMSQSLKMIRGDFPPSSRETFFTLLTAQL